MVDNKNNLIIAFTKYLAMNYSNDKTRSLYLSRSKYFLNKIEEETGIEPTEVTQDMIDNEVIKLNSNKRKNPFYKGFLRAFHEAFNKQDENGNDTLKLRIKRDRSREAKILHEYDWITKEQIQELIDKGSTYISLTTQMFWETALRLNELIGLDLNNKECKLDLTRREICGIGKGNKDFKQNFSKEMAGRLEIWLQECTDPTRPFMMFKTSGEPFKNQSYQYWYLLKREANTLGIKTASGKNVHPHCYRHSRMLWLRREKGWSTEELMKYGRHSNPSTTTIYSGATSEEITKKLNDEIFDKKV